MAVALPGNLPFCTHRYLLMVSYLGSKYLGSQRQVARDKVSTQSTVQEAIEWSLETFLPKKRCKITSSSRTDRGVHAHMNCFSLPLMDFEMPTEYMKRKVNETLAGDYHDIVVNECVLVKTNFHPRRLAVGREYIYRLAVFDDPKHEHLGQKHNPPRLLHLLPVTELYKTLPLTSFNLDKAMEVAELFSGEHDFKSFAKRDSNALEPVDTVRDIKVTITKSEPTVIAGSIPFPFTQYEIHFKSHSFLYNQIRRMVGAILSYASYNRVDLERIKFILDHPGSKNWTGRYLIAEPWGLFLSHVDYSRASFEGAIKTLMDKSEIPVDESVLPATVGLLDVPEPVLPEDEIKLGDNSEKDN